MKFVQYPVWIKKEIISFAVIAPAEVHLPIVKNVVLTLFHGITVSWHKASTSLIEFHFISTRAENPCSQR